MKTCLLAMALASAVAFAAQAPGNANPADHSPAAVRAINRFNPDDPDIILGRYLFKDRLSNNPVYFVSGYMDISDAPPNSNLVSNKGNRFTSFFDRIKIPLLRGKRIPPIPPNAAFARISPIKTDARHGSKWRRQPIKLLAAKSCQRHLPAINCICCPTPNESLCSFANAGVPTTTLCASPQPQPSSAAASAMSPPSPVPGGERFSPPADQWRRPELLKCLPPSASASRGKAAAGHRQIIGDSYTQGAFSRTFPKSGQVWA